MNKKIKLLTVSLALGSMLYSCYSGGNEYVCPDAPITEVPFTKVHLNDVFWSPRIETNRTVSIPL